jgi:hypothetical protein
VSSVGLERVGEKWTTNDFGDIIIVGYANAHNCDVKFEDNTVVKGLSYTNIKKGRVSNPNSITVYGVGFIGQGKYTSKINGKTTKVYDTWTGILRRCYSKKFHLKYSTYKYCTVEQSWHNFQVFAKWFEENYVEGFQLDKDILVKGNKVYSPETCCFVPQEINSIFVSCKSVRGRYPLGVSESNKKFKGSIQLKGKQVTLGRFNTPEEAFQAYKTAKEAYIKEVADKWKDRITKECYGALYNYVVEITD